MPEPAASQQPDNDGGSQQQQPTDPNAPGQQQQTDPNAADAGQQQPGADGKQTPPDDGKQTPPDDGKQKPDDSQKPDSAPEKYEAFKVPEGLQLDPAMNGKFETVAKDLNLSQENAQKLIDLASENVQQILKAQSDKLIEIRDGWVTELKADKEYGGEKFDETVERAKRTLKDFGEESLVAMLESWGLGDHPGLIRMLAKIDKKFGEQKAVGGEPAKDAPKSAAQTIYPQQNS